MTSAHKIVPINPSHTALLAAASLAGVDIAPTIQAERFIGYGETKHGYGPACIIDMAGTKVVAEPHVIWFPWTTPRNRIINFKWAMDHMAKDREVFLTVAKAEIPLFEHYVKRGLLRKVGYLNRMPEVEEIHMYQYKRKSA